MDKKAKKTLKRKLILSLFAISCFMPTLGVIASNVDVKFKEVVAETLPTDRPMVYVTAVDNPSGYQLDTKQETIHALQKSDVNHVSFCFRLYNPTNAKLNDITVTYHTENFTAIDGVDYKGVTNGTVTIQTSLGKTCSETKSVDILSKSHGVNADGTVASRMFYVVIDSAQESGIGGQAIEPIPTKGMEGYDCCNVFDGIARGNYYANKRLGCVLKTDYLYETVASRDSKLNEAGRRTKIIKEFDQYYVTPFGKPNDEEPVSNYDIPNKKKAKTTQQGSEGEPTNNDGLLVDDADFWWSRSESFHSDDYAMQGFDRIVSTKLGNAYGSWNCTYYSTSEGNIKAAHQIDIYIGNYMFTRVANIPTSGAITYKDLDISNNGSDGFEETQANKDEWSIHLDLAINEIYRDIYDKKMWRFSQNSMCSLVKYVTGVDKNPTLNLFKGYSMNGRFDQQKQYAYRDASTIVDYGSEIKMSCGQGLDDDKGNTRIGWYKIPNCDTKEKLGLSVVGRANGDLSGWNRMYGNMYFTYLDDTTPEIQDIAVDTKSLFTDGVIRASVKFSEPVQNFQNTVLKASSLSEELEFLPVDNQHPGSDTVVYEYNINDYPSNVLNSIKFTSLGLKNAKGDTSYHAEYEIRDFAQGSGNIARRTLPDKVLDKTHHINYDKRPAGVELDGDVPTNPVTSANVGIRILKSKSGVAYFKYVKGSADNAPETVDDVWYNTPTSSETVYGSCVSYKLEDGESFATANLALPPDPDRNGYYYLYVKIVSSNGTVSYYDSETTPGKFVTKVNIDNTAPVIKVTPVYGAGGETFNPMQKKFQIDVTEANALKDNKVYMYITHPTVKLASKEPFKYEMVVTKTGDVYTATKTLTMQNILDVFYKYDDSEAYHIKDNYSYFQIRFETTDMAENFTNAFNYEGVDYLDGQSIEIFLSTVPEFTSVVTPGAGNEQIKINLEKTGDDDPTLEKIIPNMYNVGAEFTYSNENPDVKNDMLISVANGNSAKFESYYNEYGNEESPYQIIKNPSAETCTVKFNQPGKYKVRLFQGDMYSGPYEYQITDGLADSTPNYLKTTDPQLLPKNVAYKLSSEATRAVYNPNGTISLIPYCGGAEAIFSDKARASAYIQYMEYEDLYAKVLTANEAVMLNMGTGEGYHKAQGEPMANMGEVWIRYKATSWAPGISQQTAWVWYKSDFTTSEISVAKLPLSVLNSIATVVEKTLTFGSTAYLFGDEYTSSKTGAPKLTTEQANIAKSYTMTFTACGNAIKAPSIGADNNLFSNTFTVNYGGEPIDVPICSSVELTQDSTTLYVAKYNGSFDGLIYRQISYREGETLKNALNGMNYTASSGVYSIVEVNSKGVNRFLAYVDNEAPTALISEGGTPFPTDADTAVNIYATQFSIEGNPSSQEVDPYAYVAIMQNGRLYIEEGTNRVGFFKTSETTKFDLPDGSYDIIIGDRSGNNYAFKVSIRNDEIKVSFKAAEDQSKYTISITNREIDEIVTYDVYLDEINVNNELIDPKVFYATGEYRVVITDQYGISYDHTEAFSRTEPEIYFSYFDNDGDWKGCSQDPQNTSIIIKDGLTGKIATTKYLLRVKYDPNLYNIVINDADPSAYTLDEVNGYLTFTRKINCSFTVTFKTDAKSYVTYNIVIDEAAPNIVGSYTSEVYETIDKTVEGYDVPNDMPKDLGYYNIVDPYTGKIETTTTVIGNGDKVLADHIHIVISDTTALKEIILYKDGAVILDELITSGTKFDKYLDSKDGYYQIVAYDVFRNVSNLTFTMDGESFGSATIDGEKVTSCGPNAEGRDYYYYGNTSATVNVPVGCKGVVVLEQNGVKYCYVLTPIAGELYLSRYMSTNDDGVLKIDDKYGQVQITDKVYTPIEGVDLKFIFNNDGSVTVQFMNGDVKTKLTVRVDKTGEIFDLYNFELSNEKTQLVFLDPAGTKLDEENGYIYCSSIARPVDPDTDGKIIMVGYNPLQESFAPGDYVIYTADYEYPGDGFYSFICINKYGNESKYTIIANKSLVAVLTEKFSEKEDEVHPLVDGQYYYANGSISITGYRMESMECEVGEITVDGEATVLTIKTPGTYKVVLTDINTNSAIIYVVIGSEEIKYDESWLKGYNELAVLKDEGYTNQKLTVAMDENDLLSAGVYQIYYIYDGKKTVIFGWTADGQYIQYNEERFAYCIGEQGNGVYEVYFANQYGDVCVKTINYSTEDTLSITKITNQSPESIIVALEDALSDGVYSNGSVTLSSTLAPGEYIFKVKSGEGGYVDQNIGYPFEIPSASESGEVYYTVIYIDAYGNCYEFNINLFRRQVNFDTTNVNSFVVDNTTYTKENFSFEYDEVNFTITYTVNSGEPQYYPSGLVISSDGKYQFKLVDKAGNQNVLNIIKDCVVDFRISVPESDGRIENGSVTNSSVVILSSSDFEGATIVVAKLNGEQISIQNNTFTKSGFYELLIKDKIGNVTYFTFYLVGHELSSFEYTVSGDYLISNVYFINNEGIKVTAMGVVSEDFRHLDLLDVEVGTYQVSIKNKYDNTIKSFTIIINKDAPKASLVGCNSGDTTTNEITLADLEKGDEIDVYRDGKLIKTVVIDDGTEFEKITEGGNYRLVIRSRKGTAVEFNFNKLTIANTPLSILLIVVLLAGTVGLLTGLILRSRSKTDD